MSRYKSGRAVFSLVEVTLALGIAGFCLIALMGLLPMGIKTNQTSFSQTAAATILSDVVADMRAAGKNATSAQYQITFLTRKDLYFDSEGGFNTALQTNSRYRVVITFPTLSPNPAYATCANVKISWPAVIDPSDTSATAKKQIGRASCRERV